jgi:hypothetical protein
VTTTEMQDPDLMSMLKIPTHRFYRYQKVTCLTEYLNGERISNTMLGNTFFYLIVF